MATAQMLRRRRVTPRNGAAKLVFATLLLTLLSSCTNGVNAGREGGVAFILMAVMLVLMVAILWFILGREE